MRFASVLSRISLATLVFATSASANGPVLHEPIPPDAVEDTRFGIGIEGELPPMLQTPGGVVQAPDPRKLPSPAPRTPAPDSAIVNAPPDATFPPDRDTRRPNVVPYDDPFTPSIAPFKRLLAFDAVDAREVLKVASPRLVPVPSHAPIAADGSDDVFYADLVVDLVPGRPARVPTVAAGAKIVHAHAGVGSSDLAIRFSRDGAENLFVQSDVPARARLVMELAAPHAAFGGELGDPSWSDLPKTAPLPPKVARDASVVAARIGVSRAQSPRQVVSKLVGYFRSFVDSDLPPGDGADVYMDLALSRKGVCRHRAFAFVVTALGLGLPARMVANEAHAWVEVHDGALWRRIDLGGAGRAMDAPSAAGGPKHEPPPDPFAWPSNAEPGDALAETARAGGMSSSANGGRGAHAAGASSAESSVAPSPSASSSAAPDERPLSNVTVSLVDSDPHRGAPLHVRGDVGADGAACAHVLVDLSLRDSSGRELPLGALATGDDGAYSGALVVPSTATLGDYDLVARTSGDMRCGRGSTP